VLALDWVRRVPTVVSLDATPLQYDAMGAPYGHSTGPSGLERLKWHLNRVVFRSAARLVTWSDWARRGLVQGYEVEAERVDVIPPGTHVSIWSPPPAREGRTGPVRVLFVGGDAPRKGGLLLLEAVRLLQHELPLEVDIVTQTALDPAPGVRIHRDVQANSDTLRRLYHDADVFCLPTEGDCLPLVLAEAASSGLPAISTALTAIPEIVRHGETGLLVPPRDSVALLDALRRLVTDRDLRLRMGRRAAALAAEEHDAGRNAIRVLEVIKRAVRRDLGPSPSTR
jgi:glycosyltransferase involved in cell wall biosynthesis